MKVSANNFLCFGGSSTGSFPYNGVSATTNLADDSLLSNVKASLFSVDVGAPRLVKQEAYSKILCEETFKF